MDDKSLLLPLTLPHRSLMDFSSVPLTTPTDLMSFAGPFCWSPITRQPPRALTVSAPLLLPPSSCAVILPPALPSPAMVSFVPLGVPRLPFRNSHSAGPPSESARIEAFDANLDATRHPLHPPEDADRNAPSEPARHDSFEEKMESLVGLETSPRSPDEISTHHDPLCIESLDNTRHTEDPQRASRPHSAGPGHDDLEPFSAHPYYDDPYSPHPYSSGPFSDDPYSDYSFSEDPSSADPSPRSIPSIENLVPIDFEMSNAVRWTDNPQGGEHSADSPSIEDSHSANPPLIDDPHSANPPLIEDSHSADPPLMEGPHSVDPPLIEDPPRRPGPYSALHYLLSGEQESPDSPSSPPAAGVSPPAWPFLIQVSPPDRVPIEPPPIPDARSLNFSHPGTAFRRSVTPPPPRSRDTFADDQSDRDWRLPFVREDRVYELRESLFRPNSFEYRSDDRLFPWPPSRDPLVAAEDLPNNGLGFELERFVSSVPRDLICPICLCVMNCPVETPCSHVFCQSCIQQSLTHRLRCPVDRKALSQEMLRPLPAIVHRILGSLVLRCSHTECDREVELENLAAHESHCPFR